MTLNNRYARSLALAWLAALSVASSPSFARETVFPDPHSLMTQAIREGSAQGVLTGDIAEHFTRQFHSTGVLQVSARVTGQLARADCKHLQVVYTKQEVQTPKGMTQAILTTELDYCLDGGPALLQGRAP